MPTKIEWTDEPWNPITGCSVVSPGCTNCYAMRLAGTRLKNERKRIGLTEIVNGNAVWNGQVRFNRDELQRPLRWRKPKLIFICPHGDLFHEAVETDWIDQILSVVALAPQHTFQLLTKRPERMYRYFLEGGGNIIRDRVSDRCERYWPFDFVKLVGIPRFCDAWNRLLRKDGWPLPNLHVGVSVENQQWAAERIPWLLQTPAAVHWISAEPLLGPLDLENLPVDVTMDGLAEPLRGSFNAFDGTWAEAGSDAVDRNWRKLDWVVAGGESGPKARPMHKSWARGLRDQCAANGAAFFFKQWGEWAPMADAADFPLDNKRRDHAFFGGELVHKIGKQRAGRMLDGRLHSEYPA